MPHGWLLLSDLGDEGVPEGFAGVPREERRDLEPEELQCPGLHRIRSTRVIGTPPDDERSGAPDGEEL